MTRLARLAFVAAPLALMACGGSEDGAPLSAAGDDVRDVRVAAPAPDPAYIDYIGPEMIVEPGEEKLFCLHITYDGEDTAFNKFEMLQGKFGHHAVLLGTKKPLAHGTVEDCTDISAMAKLDAFAIPSDELPKGRGVSLPKGKQMVLQSHYLNTDSKPILIRDAVRIKKLPVQDVTTWVSAYGTNATYMKIPPHSKGSMSFDCTIPKDVSVLLFGGHMHEWGSRFEALIGPSVAELKSVYVVDSWTQDYRDNPPVNLYFDKAMPLPQGSVVRTNCEWNNGTANELGFPEEMCSTFGYVEGTKETVQCLLMEP